MEWRNETRKTKTNIYLDVQKQSLIDSKKKHTQQEKEICFLFCNGTLLLWNKDKQIVLFERNLEFKLVILKSQR